jgi:hypothetical protein
MTSEFEQWRITRELHAQIKLEAAKTGLKMHELATMAWRCYLEAKSGHKIVDQPKPDKLDGHIEELEKHLGGCHRFWITQRRQLESSATLIMINPSNCHAVSIFSFVKCTIRQFPRTRPPLT